MSLPRKSTVSVTCAGAFFMLAQVANWLEAPWSFALAVLAVLFFMLWAIVEAIREAKP